MTQSSCKRDTKSKSHPGMKLAPVGVFSCKHPLSLKEVKPSPERKMTKLLIFDKELITCVRD